MELEWFRMMRLIYYATPVRLPDSNHFLYILNSSYVPTMPRAISIFFIHIINPIHPNRVQNWL